MHRRLPARQAPPSDNRRGAILDIVQRSLATALDGQCSRRYDGNVILRRVDDQSHPGRATLCVECRGLIRVTVRLDVRPMDGHMYMVNCSVGDGPRERFPFSQPRGSGVRLSLAPVLGEQLAEHVLRALKEELGDRLLDSPAGPPPGSFNANPN